MAECRESKCAREGNRATPRRVQIWLPAQWLVETRASVREAKGDRVQGMLSVVGMGLHSIMKSLTRLYRMLRSLLLVEEAVQKARSHVPVRAVARRPGDREAGWRMHDMASEISLSNVCHHVARRPARGVSLSQGVVLSTSDA